MIEAEGTHVPEILYFKGSESHAKAMNGAAYRARDARRDQLIEAARRAEAGEHVK